ncbi:hypothetical protein [Saccharothrix sp. Mg75]|uniref:hypothetical protein n=1 Tax=Saccharothrix sp. Mg75 TaxID=3445357 RepID=UPI003EEFB9FC
MSPSSPDEGDDVADRRIGGKGGGSDKGKKKSGGGAVLAAAVVGIAAAGVGGGATLSAGPQAGTSSPGLNARKAESRKSARDGDLDGALNRLGARLRRDPVRQPAAECLTHSFGQVRQFFATTPCRALDRAIFAADLDTGGVVVVSVAWVAFADRTATTRFERLVDVHGTGDVRPLGSTLLGLADIRFTAAHYWSERRGDTVAVAESEPAGGAVDPALLDALAEVAAHLPPP